MLHYFIHFQLEPFKRVFLLTSYVNFRRVKAALYLVNFNQT